MKIEKRDVVTNKDGKMVNHRIQYLLCFNHTNIEIELPEWLGQLFV